MLKTRICDLLGVEHPVLLGGMSTHTTPKWYLVSPTPAAWASWVVQACRPKLWPLTPQTYAPAATVHSA